MKGVSQNIVCNNILIELHKKILKTYEGTISSDRLDDLYNQAGDDVGYFYPLKLLFRWEKLCKNEVTIKE